MTAENEAWFIFLDHGMRDLVQQAYALLEKFKSQNPGSKQDEFHDYSFVVFPMAKAYEGFLKKWFYQHGLIDEYAYRSDHFRIGKALNPSLPAKYKRDWYVYDELIARCSDPSLGDKLWQAWKDGRNLVFHYFPDHEHFLTLREARERIEQLAEAMRYAVSCTVGVAGNRLSSPR